MGVEVNGLIMTARQFDRALFEPGHRFELINGVCVVAPPPDENERLPNDVLSFTLRLYQQGPHGRHLNQTMPEHQIAIGSNRRRADRVIWCGLGRHPKRGELPTIVIELVSEGRRSWIRDYETKRDEYLAAGVREYWIINRFDRTITVWSKTTTGRRKKVWREEQTLQTDLLPGFELPIAEVMGEASRWDDSAS